MGSSVLHWFFPIFPKNFLHTAWAPHPWGLKPYDRNNSPTPFKPDLTLFFFMLSKYRAKDFPSNWHEIIGMVFAKQMACR